MTRPLIDSTIEELEELLRTRITNHQVLGELRSELTFRSTKRAKLLLRQVDAVMSGAIPPPVKGMKPPNPSDQGGFDL